MPFFFKHPKMILLQKNVDCLICLTLGEMALTTLPDNWLFVFEREQSQGATDYTYYQQFTDISTAEQDFNLFIINVGVNITIPIIGDYFYRCYQMPNNTSIDPTEGHLVESGKMRLIDTLLDVPTFVVNTNRKIYAN